MILNTISELVALSTIPTDNHVHVLGYNTPADGGGGDFYWDAASGADDNGGTVFEGAPSGTTGRWIRYYSESVNLKWFGAAGDGTTNDSPAFQKMIDYCEPAGIKDVVIPFGEFYLEESVYVRIGGIKFVGQGTMQREDSWWGPTHPNSAPDHIIDIAQYKGSTLVIKKNISGIVYDTTVCNSVYWRGVGFRAADGRTAGNTYAIDFRGIFTGPTWPFNVHECYFNGFNRVFNFNGGDTLYNIASINVTYCAFKQNDEIIYQGFKENSNERYICWGLNFQYNKAHDNSRIIYGYYAKDLVTISNNNLEGNIAYSKETKEDPDVYPSYAVDIEVDDCAVLFHGNHFESMASDCVSISSLRKNADGTYKAVGNTTALRPSHYVDIYGNSIGTGEIHKAYTLTGCIVRINELVPIFVHACEIMENSGALVYLNDYARENGSIIKFSNQEWLSSNFLKDLSYYNILTNPTEQAYLDSNGEQWIRTKLSIFNIYNGYQYDTSNVAYCISVYKVKNNAHHFATQSAPRYDGWNADTYVSGTVFPPFGESLIVCIFPEKVTYDNLFRTALDLYYPPGPGIPEDTESIEVCSSVFSYLTDSENPEIIPVFEASNVVSETGTFEAGQIWHNGTKLRTATTSGTAGILTGITVVNASGNKIQLSSAASIAQGQYVEINAQQYRINELRGDWATLSSTPATPIAINSTVGFVAPTFSDVLLTETDPVYTADKEKIVSGDNATKTSYVSDFNAPLPTGIYNGNDANGDIDNNWNLLFHMRHVGTSSNYGADILSTMGISPTSYLGWREISNGSYSPWRKIWTEMDFGIGTFIQNQYGSAQPATAWISGDFITDSKIGIGTNTPAQSLDVDGTIRQSAVTAAILKANSNGDIVAAIAGTDYMAPTTVLSGTYTPTVTPTPGLTGTFTPTTFTYTRIGNVVHVAGTIEITFGSATLLPAEIIFVSLPISTTLNDEYDITGVGSGIGSSQPMLIATITGNTAGNNAAVFYKFPNDVTMTIQFDYIVR